MARERAKLRNRTISSSDFRSRRKEWFHTIRKAKRSSWESFLQEGKEEDIWKAISGKQSQLPMAAAGLHIQVNPQTRRRKRQNS
jgi:hypothetical protein